jgi:hypothetical protein
MLLTGAGGQNVPQLTVLADTFVVSSKSLIRLGLAGSGGGALHITNNPNDNRIWLEAWNSADNGSATEMLLTGAGGQNVPRLSLLANTTNVNGDISVTGDVLLTGADCAEHFDVAGRPPDPGTVVVIDVDGALRESREAYDKKVAGVVSGAGEYRHGLVLDKRSSQEGRIPVALVGKVYCKVDAQYSSIEVGDLLTTSETPGHAMKAVEPWRALGSIIGKALRPLPAGKSLIPILIALQ